MNQIARRCREILQDHYGDQLQGLILYGSVARHQAKSSRDIDLLVLLSKPFDYFRELRTISDLLYPIELESERQISVQPAAADEFERGAVQVYRNAKREGHVV